LFIVNYSLLIVEWTLTTKMLLNYKTEFTILKQ
jgi:hypothetical protein